VRRFFATRHKHAATGRIGCETGTLQPRKLSGAASTEKIEPRITQRRSAATENV